MRGISPGTTLHARVTLQLYPVGFILTGENLSPNVWKALKRCPTTFEAILLNTLKVTLRVAVSLIIAGIIMIVLQEVVAVGLLLQALATGMSTTQMRSANKIVPRLKEDHAAELRKAGMSSMLTHLNVVKSCGGSSGRSAHNLVG